MIVQLWRVHMRVGTKNARVTRSAVRSHQTPGTQYRAPSDPQLALPERPSPCRWVHHTRQPMHGPSTLLHCNMIRVARLGHTLRTGPGSHSHSQGRPKPARRAAQAAVRRQGSVAHLTATRPWLPPRGRGAGGTSGPAAFAGGGGRCVAWMGATAGDLRHAAGLGGPPQRDPCHS